MSLITSLPLSISPCQKKKKIAAFGTSKFPNPYVYKLCISFGDRNRRKSFLINKSRYGEIEVRQNTKFEVRIESSGNEMQESVRMDGSLLEKLARWSDHVDDGADPFTRGVAVGLGAGVVTEAPASGELFRVKDKVSVSSSGIVANFFRTCLRAGRRMGLLKHMLV